MMALVVSCGVLGVVIGAAVGLSRLGGRSWVALFAPCGYLISLAFLFTSQNSISTTLQPLVLLPILWGALYHRLRESTAVVLAAMCTVAVTTWLAHAPGEAIIRTAGLWGFLGAIVMLGAHNLRRGLGDAIDERAEALRQATVLGNVARELNSTLVPQEVVAIGVRLAAEIASPPGLRPVRANYCRISDGIVRVDAEYDGEGQWLGQTWPLSEHPHLWKVAQSQIATSGSLDFAELGPTVRSLAAAQGVRHGGWVPVVIDGELHGVLAVAGRNRPVSDQELSRCAAIARIMELALQNAIAHEHVQLAALTDPLTSLSNRRGMEQLVRDRWGRQPLAVMTIDVDQLKAVNDDHGHAAGDELIQLVAEAIRSVMRNGDVAARVGGDEFACFVFDSDEQAALRVAGRMLDSVRGAQGRRHAPRISIGVACAQPGASLEDSIRRADLAMYEAKQAGGMRYELAPREPVAELPEREAAA
jgi:diguanylate cyclase (GGDEF)-like protein